jgi:hypothetical protein
MAAGSDTGGSFWATFADDAMVAAAPKEQPKPPEQNLRTSFQATPFTNTVNSHESNGLLWASFNAEATNTQVASVINNTNTASGMDAGFQTFCFLDGSDREIQAHKGYQNTNNDHLALLSDIFQPSSAQANVQHQNLSPLKDTGPSLDWDAFLPDIKASDETISTHNNLLAGLFVAKEEATFAGQVDATNQGSGGRSFWASFDQTLPAEPKVADGNHRYEVKSLDTDLVKEANSFFPSAEESFQPTGHGSFWAAFDNEPSDVKAPAPPPQPVSSNEGADSGSSGSFWSAFAGEKSTEAEPSTGAAFMDDGAGSFWSTFAGEGTGGPEASSLEKLLKTPGCSVEVNEDFHSQCGLLPG